MKKTISLLALLLLVTSCGSESSDTSTNTSTDTSTNTSSSNPIMETNNNLNIPVQDVIDEPIVTDGVTYYPDPDPIVDDPAPGSDYQGCGVLYRVMNSDQLMFSSDSNSTLFNANDYGRQARTIMSQIRFNGRVGAEALQVCFQGYQNGSDVFVENIQSYSSTSNPTDLDGYNVRICGYTAYQRSSNGQDYLVLQSEQVNYIINNISPQGVPAVARAYVDATNGVESCYYGNSAPYRDFSITHKPFFNASAVDLGDL